MRLRSRGELTAGGAASCERSAGTCRNIWQHLGAGAQVGSAPGRSGMGANSTLGAPAAAAHGVTLQGPVGSLRGGDAVALPTGRRWPWGCAAVSGQSIWHRAIFGRKQGRRHAAEERQLRHSPKGS